MNRLTRAAFYDSASYTRWRGPLCDSEGLHRIGFNTVFPSVPRTDHDIRIPDFVCAGNYAAASRHPHTQHRINLQLMFLLQRWKARLLVFVSEHCQKQDNPDGAIYGLYRIVYVLT